MVAIGTTYQCGDPALLEVILPRVDFIEISPDGNSCLQCGRPTISETSLAELRDVSQQKRVIAHGTGLSIATHDGWSDDYIALLDLLFANVDLSWHSEHLSFTNVDGRDTGTMLVMPRRREVADLVIDRVEKLQSRYGVPFLLENVANLLPEHPQQDYSPAAFLNEIAHRSGCGLLLDVYNLECDVRNQRVDLLEFFAELDFDCVREVHVANGVEHRGMLLDVHSRRTRPETLAIADEVLRRAGNVEVLLFEILPQALPGNGLDAVAGELDMLRERYGS